MKNSFESINIRLTGIEECICDIRGDIEELKRTKKNKKNKKKSSDREGRYAYRCSNIEEQLHDEINSNSSNEELHILKDGTFSPTYISEVKKLWLQIQEDCGDTEKEWRKLISNNSYTYGISEKDKENFKQSFISGFIAGLNHKNKK